MRIAICDDEEIYRIELKTILDKMLANADYDSSGKLDADDAAGILRRLAALD